MIRADFGVKSTATGPNGHQRTMREEQLFRQILLDIKHLKLRGIL